MLTDNHQILNHQIVTNNHQIVTNNQITIVGVMWKRTIAVMICNDTQGDFIYVFVGGGLCALILALINDILVT